MGQAFRSVWIVTVMVFVVLLTVLPGAPAATEKPQVFAQTGHAGSIEFVAINPSASHLVTKEAGQYVKTWEVATGREIRTIKLQTEYGRASNLYFVDDRIFMVLYQKTAELYDLYGQKLRSVTLPKFAGTVFLDFPVIGKDGQYLFNQSFGTKIYSLKDGSELVLPELGRYKSYEMYAENQGVSDLGFGYYGVFHKGAGQPGTVDYVLYDDSLNIRRKGSLVIPTIAHGSKFKLSPDGKQLAYQGHGLFTWALVQGLQGKADKGRTGYVRTTDLAAYVEDEDEAPNLAEKIFKRAQFPTVSISGQGFPVGRVR